MLHSGAPEKTRLEQIAQPRKLDLLLKTEIKKQSATGVASERFGDSFCYNFGVGPRVVQYAKMTYVY